MGLFYDGHFLINRVINFAEATFLLTKLELETAKSITTFGTVSNFRSTT